MDIVRRAYHNVMGIPTEKAVIWQEVKRLIKARAYSTKDWPREWGPLPEDLRAKRPRKEKGDPS